MLKRYNYRSLIWIDLESPTNDEVSSLVKEFKLHPLLGEEISSRSIKPRFDLYKHCAFAILHFPIRTHIKGKYFIIEKEVDFAFGKDYIITTKYDTVEPLHNLSKIFEINSILDKTDLGDNAGVLFYYMVRRLYKNVANDLESIKDELLNIESRIFKGEERHMVMHISNVARQLLDFNQIMKGHDDILKTMSSTNMSEFFGQEYKVYLDDLILKHSKIQEMIANNKELLADLRDTNDSLLTTKQTEVTKLFTIMAFVTFPLSLFLDIFTIPSEHVPIIGLPYDFAIIIGMMIVLTIIMFIFFKWKKWV